MTVTSHLRCERINIEHLSCKIFAETIHHHTFCVIIFCIYNQIHFVFGIESDFQHVNIMRFTFEKNLEKNLVANVIFSLK